MDRKEQKQMLKSIIADTEYLKTEIEKQMGLLERVFQKIDDLDNEFSNIGEIEYWDVSQLRLNTIQAILTNTSFDNVKDSLDNFQSELESHMNDLSDYNREHLEERYGNLDTAVECLDMSECEDLGMVNDNLENVISYLKEML
jgi:hypothetical protein